MFQQPRHPFQGRKVAPVAPRSWVLSLTPGSERSLHGKQGLLELGFSTAALEWRRGSLPRSKGALRRRGEWPEEAPTEEMTVTCLHSLCCEFDPINVYLVKVIFIALPCISHKPPAIQMLPLPNNLFASKNPGCGRGYWQCRMPVQEGGGCEGTMALVWDVLGRERTERRKSH